MFKFIHTADIHLDSPLKSLALRNPQIADLVGGATRRTFERIIDLCLEEHVDALIIAGDLYDGDLRSMKTAAFLSGQMRRLEEGHIQVFIIQGNHDSESSVTKYLDLPKNVHLFTGHGGVKELSDFGVAIHGVSYTQRHAPESLLYKYKKPIEGFINIGILHTSLTGSVSHDVYAPCSLNDLIAHKFDYWALGHIHQRQIYSDSPFVVMPGIPQGRNIGENGPKSVTIVEISDGNIRIDERFVADSEFQDVRIDITDISQWSSMIAKLQKTLREIQPNIQARHLICNITFLGRSPLYWRIRRDADHLRAEIEDIAQQLENVFVDGIINQVLEPLTHSSNNTDPVDELRTFMTETSKDQVFYMQAASFLEEAIKKLPPELRNEYGEDQHKLEQTLQRFLSEGVLEVIASLKEKQNNVEIS